TPEARKAAEYIADEFRKAGLQLPPNQSSPYQAFEFTSGIKLGSKNALSMNSVTGKTRTYVLNKDFIPLGYSSDATLQKIPVVFANYGIRAPDLKHDDYEGLDIKDKAVIVYRFGPEGDDPKSSFALYYPLRYKAMVARELGASALLVISEDEKEDELLPLRKDSSFGTAGIAVFNVKRSIAAEWMNAVGVQFPSQDPHGRSGFELPGAWISLTSDLIREKSKSDNVLGWLPASQSTDETVIIGAHYDHLGLGIEGSLAAKSGDVHNGADDNASGVAGLLELARFFASRKDQLPRNLLFVAFGGEELGVLGSNYFVKNPIIPLKQIVAMLNMDMIGRLRDDKLIVGGAGTSPQWKGILDEMNGGKLKLTLNEDGYGPSDHSLFYGKDIPVLFFFTGAHAEYHKPEDDADRIGYDGMMKVVNYVARIADRILEMPAKPQFARVKSTSQEIATRGFRVYLGTIPDYGEEVKGVKLTGVREASPAQTAGIRAGDIIVEFGGKKIENIYDYTYALQQHKPGETVPMVIVRDEKRLTVEVKLEQRASTQ
ncbi:MAG TPA: M28 family peptidase, partial [Acidobacteriota bacterium]|nr:M28 family peptidase [Acidobacteriota bacterium]